MTEIGRRFWAFAAGDIPVGSTGREPEFTSHDRLCVLNAAAEPADIEIEIFHADRAPVAPYRLQVPARRVRHVRINDLIDPEAVPLGRPYGWLLRSSVPVVVQMLRQDTRQGANATLALSAWPVA